LINFKKLIKQASIHTTNRFLTIWWAIACICWRFNQKRKIYDNALFYNKTTSWIWSSFRSSYSKMEPKNDTIYLWCEK